ncbi:MAG: hypothetical protein JWM82_2440, partial [Myxococcales bacterium]|nr:hypothetical protein [Myxococcales bacterium]
GDVGTAGADGGTAGVGGVAGAGGDTGGTGGTPPPPPTYCESHPAETHALPYTITNDFKVAHILTNSPSYTSGSMAFSVVAKADCTDNPAYPAFPPPPSDGGADGAAGDGGDDSGDGGAAAGSDGGTINDAASDGGATGDAPSDVATDAPAVDASADAPIDAPASDASTSDAGGADVLAADGGAMAPACIEFGWNPTDACPSGTCWGGVVFEAADVQGPSADTKGVCIAPGAMSVSWWARASVAGAKVKFGFLGEGMGVREAYFTVPATWTHFQLNIDPNDANYNITAGDAHGVWNAFSVVMDNMNAVGSTYIEVKDIQWLATPAP